MERGGKPVEIRRVVEWLSNTQVVVQGGGGQNTLIEVGGIIDVHDGRNGPSMRMRVTAVRDLRWEEIVHKGNFQENNHVLFNNYALAAGFKDIESIRRAMVQLGFGNPRREDRFVIIYLETVG